MKYETIYSISFRVQKYYICLHDATSIKKKQNHQNFNQLIDSSLRDHPTDKNQRLVNLPKMYG